MTRAKQIIALSEWSGWTKVIVTRTDPLEVAGYDERARRYNLGMQTVPSESLNWIAALEGRLTDEQRRAYAAQIEAAISNQYWLESGKQNFQNQLCLNTGDPNGSADYEVLFTYINAGAGVRIESLCRTLWPEKFQ